MAQRRMVLRIYAVYRTLFFEAAGVIAGVPPFDLLALERVRIYENGKDHKKLAAAETLTSWQSRWDSILVMKAQWTKRLISNISVWFLRKHGEINHYMTQILSGHGCFQAYLKKFKIILDDRCVYCKIEIDTAEHTLFHCSRWAEDRASVYRNVRLSSTPDNMVSKMLENKIYWDAISNLMNIIMKTKLDDTVKSCVFQRQSNTLM